jgi:hypothetical protein
VNWIKRTTKLTVRQRPEKGNDMTDNAKPAFAGTCEAPCCAGFTPPPVRHKQAACRNCGVGRGIVRECYSTGRGHGYVVQCNQEDCREIGPWSSTENGARRKWNKRMQDMHNAGSEGLT